MNEIRNIIKQLKSKRNVIGGSLTLQKRIKNGRVIEGTNVIRIYVSRKMPSCLLDKRDLVPLKINGFETDVVEIGDVKALDGYPDPKNRFRPLLLGISTMNFKSDGGCSLGMFATDNKTGELIQVSNQHCFGLENKAVKGDPVGQPSKIDHGREPADITGYFIRGVELKYSNFNCPYRDLAHRFFRIFLSNINRVDVSCASVTCAEGFKMETPNGIKIKSKGEPNMSEKVWAFGRTSGYSHNGEYLDLNGFIRVQYSRGICEFEDIVIGRINETFRCDPGDSGSPFFQGDSFIGLRFAGSDSVWIGCKASNIEKELDITFNLQTNASASS